MCKDHEYNNSGGTKRSVEEDKTSNGQTSDGSNQPGTTDGRRLSGRHSTGSGDEYVDTTGHRKEVRPGKKCTCNVLLPPPPCRLQCRYSLCPRPSPTQGPNSVRCGRHHSGINQRDVPPLDMFTPNPRTNRHHTGHLQILLGWGQQSNLLGTLRDSFWSLENSPTLKCSHTNNLHTTEPDYKVRRAAFQMEEWTTSPVGKGTRCCFGR